MQKEEITSVPWEAKENLGTSATSQPTRDTCHQACWPEFCPSDPYGKELALLSCPPTCIHMFWHVWTQLPFPLINKQITRHLKSKKIQICTHWVNFVSILPQRLAPLVCVSFSLLWTLKVCHIFPSTFHLFVQTTPWEWILILNTVLVTDSSGSSQEAPFCKDSRLTNTSWEEGSSVCMRLKDRLYSPTCSNPKETRESVSSVAEAKLCPEWPELKPEKRGRRAVLPWPGPSWLSVFSGKTGR